MSKVLFKPLPTARDRAKAMADELHNRIAYKVGVKGAPFSETYSSEVAATAGAWRQSPHVDDETYHHALQYASGSLNLRAKIVEARSMHKHRWFFWR